jgi:Ankyrin repeats (3 copies)
MSLKSDLIGKKTTSVIPVTHDVFTLVKEGNLEALDRMMQHEDFNVNVTRWSGFSLLHRAASEGQTDVCDMLIKRGARVNQRTVWGWYTPLHLSLANGYEDTAKYLIEQGANIRAKARTRRIAATMRSAGGSRSSRRPFASVSRDTRCNKWPR